MKTIDLTQSATEKELNLQCVLPSSTYRVSYCQFERPDGKIFLLKDGANSGRYTYYGKGIENRECGISIELPLAKEDIGIWACKLYLDNNIATGGFMVVNSPTQKEKGTALRKLFSLFLIKFEIFLPSLFRFQLMQPM